MEFSVNKERWSIKRESQYRKDCEKLLKQKRLNLAIDGNKVYIESANVEELLLTVSDVSKFWYETYLELNNYKSSYGVD